MNGFEVDPAALRRADQGLADVLHHAVADLERFEGECAGQGEPWGADDLGILIGEVYKGAYAMAMNCLYSNLDTMSAYGERLTVAAENYEATDETVAQRLRRVGSALGLPADRGLGPG